MLKRARSSSLRHEAGAFESARAGLVSLFGSRLRWLGRQRFPLPPEESEAWREIERNQLILPSSEQPEVSIVIPVHGQLATTWGCLRSLAQVPAGIAFEVIVADDRSPDRTLEMLKHVRGVRVLENPENLGFLRTVNRAARTARGRWICLLNNDTLLTPNWLAELVTTFELFPRAGLVGAKLLFADGALQEAGGTAFRDGTTSHYGRRKDPARPEYSFARRVDYCSAACVVIPKQLWDELGGFDELYAPAYYEDTDLAFRVRRAGYEVVYQPACCVVHYEGVTHGKAKSKKPSDYQNANRQKFLERWSAVLSEHPPPETRTWRAADRRRGPGVLVLTSSLPASEATASAAQAARAADASGWRATLWPLQLESAELPTRDQLQRQGIEVLASPYVPSPLEFLRSSAIARFDALVLWDLVDSERILSEARRFAPHLKLIAFVTNEANGRGLGLEATNELLGRFDVLVTGDEAVRAKLAARLPYAKVFTLAGDLAHVSTPGPSAWLALAELIEAQR
jgi:GT2 family glycosyltransferase